MKRFTILDWNIGGAKFLEEKKRDERDETRIKINRALLDILTKRDFGPEPDLVTLQEIVQYKEPSDKILKEILDPIPGYTYFPFRLIDSNILSSRAKWDKILEGSDWNHYTYFSQGNGFLIRNDAPHFPVWDLSNCQQPRPGGSASHHIEKVHLDSGLYFGDRNTEPRAALVAHFIYDPEDKSNRPLDIFVVNLHLTTLMMEREGVPEIDSQASKIRLGQLDIVFNGIVSRYNSWKRSGFLQRNRDRVFTDKESKDRHSPVWIIAGDFNFTEDSEEYEHIMRVNFIDTVPKDGKVTSDGHGQRSVGTKASGVGKNPSLNLDYVFAGPKFVSLDPAISIHRNRVLHEQEIRASDHYPVMSTMDITPL